MNRTIASIAPSASLKITSLAKKLAGEGKSICSFAAGEPDFDTPQHIKTAAEQALQGGETKYTPAAGLMKLRAAIAAKLAADNRVEYEPEQILVSNGAKHSLFNIFMTLCETGDEVIIPAPYWLSYPEMVRIAGAEPVFVHCTEDHDLKLTPELLSRHITEKTRALVLNSPSNPIGVVYGEDELRTLVEIAVEHGIWVISDEIYEKLIYDGMRHVSPAGFSAEAYACTITVNGFSKAYAMTGWRLGYFAAPREVVKAASALQSHSTSGPNTFAQFGAIAALEGGEDCIAEMAAAFDERRAYLYDRLTSMAGVTCVKPRGAFYMLPNISSLGLDSVTFAERLLDEYGVAVVPGIAFGAPDNIRLSYACGMDNIREGMDRLEKFLAGL